MAISTGYNTKFAVSQDGIVRVVPPGNEFVLQEGERRLNYVRSLDISILPDAIITAKAEVCVNMLEVSALGRFIFFAQDPADEFKTKEVARIEFTDGSVWDWEE